MQIIDEFDAHSPFPTPGTIAFIGGGNMVRSLIAGMLADGAPAESIRVAEAAVALRDAIHRDFEVSVFAGSAEVVASERGRQLSATHG